MKKIMRVFFTSKILVVFFAVFLTSLIQGCKGQKFPKMEGRETVLDRVVYIEEELVTEIPRVERWCDRLQLIKKRISVGDAELYVEEEGKGIPLVLIHGGPGSTHHYFHPHFSRAKKFSRVIYYDQRGCGLSDYQRGKRYSVDQAVRDLESLRRALNIKKWVVLGHSYGGFLAQYYATQHPECIAGLVLVGSSTGVYIRLKPSREYDYISDEEKQRMREINREISELIEEGEISQDKENEIFLFNWHLNGSWKRQNFYRPTREELAQMALYEWMPAPHFRDDMHLSINRIDLQGAFNNCPIPTIIMEGVWDLTWNTDKPEILHENHPGSRLVMFERSSHSPFADEPEKFFFELKSFIRSLPDIPFEEIVAWRDYLEEWRKSKEDPFLVSKMGREEEAGIEEFYTIRGQILNGNKYQNLSTPLHTFLSFLSAHHFQDLDIYEEVRPGMKEPADKKEEAEMKKNLRESEKWYIKNIILRAPVPPQNPEEFTLWPVYITSAPGEELEDTYVFIFWEGKWRWSGNRGAPGNWRYGKEFFLEYFRKRIGVI